MLSYSTWYHNMYIINNIQLAYITTWSTEGNSPGATALYHCKSMQVKVRQFWSHELANGGHPQFSVTNEKSPWHDASTPWNETGELFNWSNRLSKKSIFLTPSNDMDLQATCLGALQWVIYTLQELHPIYIYTTHPPGPWSSPNRPKGLTRTWHLSRLMSVACRSWSVRSTWRWEGLGTHNSPGAALLL